MAVRKWLPWSMTLLLVAGCPGGDDDFSSGDDDDSLGDDDTSDDDIPVDPDSWELIGALDTGGGTDAFEWAAALDGWLYTKGHRWSLSDATHEELPWDGWPDGYHEQGVSCQRDTRVYLLAGGGNGVFSPWADYHWEVTDLEEHAWLEGGPHDFPIHAPGVAREQGRCVIAGGNAGGGFSPTGAVQEFLLEDETWDNHLPVPMEVMYPQAALVDGVLMVAGGGREFTDGDDEGTSWGVADDRVFLRDLDGGGDWETGPPLPMPLLYGSAVGRDGRYVVFGGVTNGSLLEGGLRSEIWSWAPGEPEWSPEGGFPIEAFAHHVLLYDGELYLVVVDPGDHELYRWLR